MEIMKFWDIKRKK